MKTQSRGARPPKSLSVAQPQTSMPMMPENSKSMMTVPDSLAEKPFASCSIVGPQSATSDRTALMEKLQSPSIQMAGQTPEATPKRARTSTRP